MGATPPVPPPAPPKKSRTMLYVAVAVVVIVIAAAAGGYAWYSANQTANQNTTPVHVGTAWQVTGACQSTVTASGSGGGDLKKGATFNVPVSIYDNDLMGSYCEVISATTTTAGFAVNPLSAPIQICGGQSADATFTVTAPQSAYSGAVTIVLATTNGTSATCPLPATVSVVSSGTVWNLNAGYYEDVGPVDLSGLTHVLSWALSGTFTASNGIDAYVMTSAQYSAWGGSGSPSSYFWTSGSGVTTGSINTNVPDGTYYFVWDNTNVFTSSSVSITSNVVATA
jgi:hypothetical protein